MVRIALIQHKYIEGKLCVEHWNAQIEEMDLYHNEK